MAQACQAVFGNQDLRKLYPIVGATLLNTQQIQLADSVSVQQIQFVNPTNGVATASIQGQAIAGELDITSLPQVPGQPGMQQIMTSGSGQGATQWRMGLNDSPGPTTMMLLAGSGLQFPNGANYGSATPAGYIPASLNFYEIRTITVSWNNAFSGATMPSSVITLIKLGRMVIMQVPAVLASLSGGAGICFSSGQVIPTNYMPNGGGSYLTPQVGGDLFAFPFTVLDNLQLTNQYALNGTLFINNFTFGPGQPAGTIFIGSPVISAGSYNTTTKSLSLNGNNNYVQEVLANVSPFANSLSGNQGGWPTNFLSWITA